MDKYEEVVEEWACIVTILAVQICFWTGLVTIVTTIYTYITSK